MPTSDDGRSQAGWEREAVQLLAGVVDLGLEQAEGALRRVRGLLGRSDLHELVGYGHEDLKARGELALNRFAPAAESHMEALARHAAAARAGAAESGAADAGAPEPGAPDA